MADEVLIEKGGLYYKKVGDPLQIKNSRPLSSLVDFAKKYGVDLELNSVGENTTAQIVTTVVKTNLKKKLDLND